MVRVHQTKTYKAILEEKSYLEIGQFFPSSKACHVCLNQVGSLLLKVHIWVCSSCQTKHDRDINAAIWIRDEGMRLLASQCGLGVSPSGATGEPVRALVPSATASGGNVRPKIGRKSLLTAVPAEA